MSRFGTVSVVGQDRPTMILCITLYHVDLLITRTHLFLKLLSISSHASSKFFVNDRTPYDFKSDPGTSAVRGHGVEDDVRDRQKKGT